jgi:hypothetical protein
MEGFIVAGLLRWRREKRVVRVAATRATASEFTALR